jgi:hypothetical protein
MALDTYTGLKTAIQTWLARADLSGDVDDMIDLFEAWANRNLRMPQMEQEATATASEYISLPIDFLELRDIQWQGSPRSELEYMTPTSADIYDTSGSPSTPKFYTLVGDQIRLIPSPSDTTVNVRIDYWKKVPALSASNTSNWMLALYPDAYLYGSLVQGHVRVQDPQLAAFIASAWSGIMRELQGSGKLANIGSLLRVRVA